MISLRLISLGFETMNFYLKVGKMPFVLSNLHKTSRTCAIVLYYSVLANILYYCTLLCVALRQLTGNTLRKPGLLTILSESIANTNTNI